MKTSFFIDGEVDLKLRFWEHIVLVVASDQTAAQQIPIWKVALWVAAVGSLKGGAEAKGGSKVMQGEVGSGLEPTRPSAQPSSWLH